MPENHLTPAMAPVDLVLAHLECCPRCRAVPGILCPIGKATMLRASAETAARILRSSPPRRRWWESRRVRGRLQPRFGMLFFILGGAVLAKTGAPPAVVWFVTACACGWAVDHGQEHDLPRDPDGT